MAEISFPEPRIGPEWARRRIGAFRDEAAFERFAAVYREAMDGLPEPDEQRTVDTSYGAVRVYRFGTGDGVPLVLMDAGKAAARARTLRDSTVEVWPEASHAINGEYPERLAERVHAFLDGVENRQG